MRGLHRQVCQRGRLGNGHWANDRQYGYYRSHAYVVRLRSEAGSEVKLATYTPGVNNTWVQNNVAYDYAGE